MADSASGDGHDSVLLSVLFAVSFTAGFVDCVCYIVLFHVFVANMTGNTIAAGIGFGQKKWSLLFRRGLAIPTFVLGLLVGRFWMKWSGENEMKKPSRFAYGFEALVLAIFIILGQPAMGPSGEIQDKGTFLFYLLVSLPSFAMGLQNATLSHFGKHSLRTTHVTGTLSNFADYFVSWCFWFRDRRPTWSQAFKDDALRSATIYLGAWVIYLVGAIMGAFFKTAWELHSLWIPIGALIIASLIVSEPTFHPQEVKE